MTDKEFQQLELQVEYLISIRGKLLVEVNSLRKQMIKLTRDRANLADKNKTASSKLKRILTQLRGELA